jgi:hypothetical protein
MIWFACKQCGKRHGRDEHLSGTLVFCECGHGNRVPWSSTVAEPPPEEAKPVPPPPPPRMPRPPLSEERSELDFLRPRRTRERRRPNPNYCLNHEETAKEATCSDCRASFCSACVVELQGQTLCGPCKNFRFGALNRPARLPALALTAFVLALVSTVISLILNFMAIGFTTLMEAGLAASLISCTVALFFAVGELILSGLALRQIDRQPALGGRGLAMTGAMAGLTGIVWAFSIAAFLIARQT